MEPLILQFWTSGDVPSGFQTLGTFDSEMFLDYTLRGYNTAEPRTSNGRLYLEDVQRVCLQLRTIFFNTMRQFLKIFTTPHCRVGPSHLGNPRSTIFLTPRASFCKIFSK